jgi:hypothetical protein
MLLSRLGWHLESALFTLEIHPIQPELAWNLLHSMALTVLKMQKTTHQTLLSVCKPGKSLPGATPAR